MRGSYAGHSAENNNESRKELVLRIAKFLEVYLLDARLQFLAGLEFDNGAFWNRYFLVGLIGIAPNARLAALHFEYTEVAELDVMPLHKMFGDCVQRELDHVTDFFLRKSGLVVDAKYDIAFGQVSWHTNNL